MRLQPSRVVEVLEKIVRTPIYSLVGIVGEGKLLVYSDEEGFASLILVDPGSGDKMRLTREPILWVAKPPVGASRVVYTRDVSGGRELQKLLYYDLSRMTEEPLVAMEPMRVFGVADDGVNVAFTGATMEDLAVYVAKGGSVEKAYRLPGLAIVSDVMGDLIVGSGVLSGNPLSMEIFLLDIGRGEFRVYTPRSGSVNKNPVIVGNAVVFESNALNPKRNELLRLDLSTWEVGSVRFAFKDYEEYAPVEHPIYKFQDNSWVVVGKREGRTRLFLDGRLVYRTEGVINGAVYNEGRVYLSYTSIRMPSRLVELNLDQGVENIILESRLPGDVEESFTNLGFTYVSSFDGVQIPVFYVESRLAGRPGPTVIYVHGGPWDEVDSSWDALIASLVATGFNVVAPNFRGSTGYGESFRQLDIGDPGGGDLEDVASVSRWAWESGLADRLFIMGYSYGGYMTLWAMASKPDLYECGVAGASVADWEEMYELGDAIFRFFIETLFAGNRGLLRERSPISRVDGVKKPICIIHPQNDTRTPLKPVIRFMSLMLEKSKTFKAHIIPDMGHVVNTVDDAMKILLPAILFLNRCLRKPYELTPP